MGFKSTYQDRTCYHRTVSDGRVDIQSYRRTTRKTKKWTWRPIEVIPSWEKEFFLQISLFGSWKNFVAYKNNTLHHFENIQNWDDSAGERAFYDARNKFYAEFHNLPPCVDTLEPNPNLYIDEIDWNQKIDPKLLEELELALLEKEEQKDLIPIRTPIEEIIPTGWDIDYDFYKWNGLTGLIVGNNSNSGEDTNVLCP